MPPVLTFPVGNNIYIAAAEAQNAAVGQVAGVNSNTVNSATIVQSITGNTVINTGAPGAWDGSPAGMLALLCCHSGGSAPSTHAVFSPVRSRSGSVKVAGR